ncbi:lysocardiolipin acyltransferase [Thraustotheca clavata]|uniref:Lysocardiolipin acyltransferase n=1 Tax=Thraustotheca clavata TaxID=74557 RepID=A0A1V9ZA77_9STRA|nr:lysocardiolipin acyltransferase [Thraustotheca clavata]
MVRVSAVGIGFIAALTITAASGVFLAISPAFFALYLLGSRVQRVFVFAQQLIQGMWLGNTAILLEKWHGIQVQIYLKDGSNVEKAQKDIAAVLSGERAIWLSNHRTRLDWMLLWSFGLRIHGLHQLKIILKESLKNVPIFGWAMQAFQFIFLTRHWENDQVYLKQALQSLTIASPNSSYLLFPEGTDLSESNVVKSNSFAAKQGKSPRQFTLYPRTTGWNHIVPLIRTEIDAIYDLTMCFVDSIPGKRANEPELIAGTMPKMMHIYLHRYSIKDLPTEDNALNAWMEDRFAEKETLLSNWYLHETIPATAVPVLDHDITSTTALIQAFWILLCSLLVMTTYTYSWMRWYLIASTIAHFIFAKYTKGMDRYLMSAL